jgi:hypothetical protein
MADVEDLQRQYPWLLPLVALLVAVLVAWVRQTTLSIPFLVMSVSSVLTQIKTFSPLKPYLKHAQTLFVLYRLTV